MISTISFLQGLPSTSLYCISITIYHLITSISVTIVMNVIKFVVLEHMLQILGLHLSTSVHSTAPKGLVLYINVILMMVVIIMKIKHQAFCVEKNWKKKKKGLGFTIPEMKLPWFWGDSGLIELVIS